MSSVSHHLSDVVSLHLDFVNIPCTLLATVYFSQQERPCSLIEHAPLFAMAFQD